MQLATFKVGILKVVMVTDFALSFNKARKRLIKKTPLLLLEDMAFSLGLWPVDGTHFMKQSNNNKKKNLKGINAAMKWWKYRDTIIIIHIRHVLILSVVCFV